MLRKFSNPETLKATEGAKPKVKEGARPKEKAVPAQSLTYIRVPAYYQNQHIDHSIDAEKVKERKEADLTIDDYEGELTFDDFSYIERVLNIPACDEDEYNSDHLSVPRELDMFIDPESNPDMIKEYFYLCEHFIKGGNFEQALRVCAQGLVSSVEYYDLSDKFNLCLSLKKISDNLKPEDKFKKPVTSFLEAINAAITEFIHEFNKPVVQASFKKAKDSETVFLKWAKKREFSDNYSPKNFHNNFFRMEYQHDWIRFQDDISKSLPVTGKNDGILLLKFLRTIGKYHRQSIEALRNVERIFKHFDDNKGLAMTYVEMTKAYNELGMPSVATKCAKLGRELEVKDTKLPRAASPRFSFRKLLMKITRKK